MNYSEKLQDPRWQKRRLEVLNRDGFACLVCGSTSETLHVHHLVYSGSDPWEVPIEKLETLCWQCHEWREEFNEMAGRSQVPTQFCYAFFRFMQRMHDHEDYSKMVQKDPDWRKNLGDHFNQFWKCVYLASKERQVESSLPITTKSLPAALQ